MCGGAGRSPQRPRGSVGWPAGDERRRGGTGDERRRLPGGARRSPSARGCSSSKEHTVRPRHRRNRPRKKTRHRRNTEETLKQTPPWTRSHWLTSRACRGGVSQRSISAAELGVIRFLRVAFPCFPCVSSVARFPADQLSPANVSVSGGRHAGRGASQQLPSSTAEKREMRGSYARARCGKPFAPRPHRSHGYARLCGVRRLQRARDRPGGRRVAARRARRDRGGGRSTP